MRYQTYLKVLEHVREKVETRADTLLYALAIHGSVLQRTKVLEGSFGHFHQIELRKAEVIISLEDHRCGSTDYGSITLPVAVFEGDVPLETWLATLRVQCADLDEQDRIKEAEKQRRIEAREREQLAALKQKYESE